MLGPGVFPRIATSRTTESFTLQSVWLYQRSAQASTSEGTSINLSAGNRTSRYVAYEYVCGSFMMRSLGDASLLPSCVSRELPPTERRSDAGNPEYCEK